MTEAPDHFQGLIERLRREPALANMLRPDVGILVWDGAAENLLWASEPAAEFAAGLVDEEGHLSSGSRARERLEILAAGLAPEQGIRLERLLLEPARLSAPVTCACRRTELADGTRVLVTAIVGPVPKTTRVSTKPLALAPAPKTTPPTGNIRFVWQTDPETRFISVSTGLAEAVGPVASDILGRLWAEMEGTLVEDPGGEIARFFDRRETWSARSIGWTVDGKAGKVAVDWAGMPIFGAERELVGFRGFGLIRRDALDVLPDAVAPEGPIAPALVTASEPAPAPYELTAEEELFERLRETVAASLSEPTLDIQHREAEGPAKEPTPEADPAPSAQPTYRVPEPQTGLSYAERNAFREIARALGARFDAEGTLTPHTPPAPVDVKSEPPVDEPVVAESDPDDEGVLDTVVAALDQAMLDEPVVDSPDPETVSAGHEPTIVSEPTELLPRASDVRQLLERLSLAALVHHGEHVVFANRALLSMSGFDDREHLAASGGLPRLFGTVPPASLRSATLSTFERNAVPVAFERATIEWDGTDADLLLLRRLPEGDTSQRVRALEADLRARDLRLHELESVLDTATDGVIVLDETGRILSLNRSAEALFGYNQNDVVGDAITVLLAPESHIVALDYIEGLRSPGVASLLNDGREVMGRVSQGGTIPLFMTMGHVNDGPDRKLCAVLRDITAFKKAVGELVGARRVAEQANSQKSDLLAKISHEIRTPLNAIIGFAEVMLEERFGPIGNERYKEYMRDVHASGAHVISLVNDLLDLAKIEAGRMDLSFTSVSLNDLVSSCFTLLQPQAARDRIVMRTSFAAKLPPVVADDRSVRQIVLNLVSNAIKFTDAGGQVIVSTALTDRGEVAFRVRDTGIGMSETEIEAALEPFRQLATSRKRGGTGLGLPLTKALVEANRGALQISSHPNEGTLVEVIFPPTRVLAE